MRETIMIMSDLIDDKDSSKALFKIVRARKANLNKTMPFHIKEATEFFAKRPELERSFFELIKQWFIAITALRPIYGSYVRVATFSHYERINRLTEMTVGKADHGRDHDCPNKLDDGVAGAAY